MENSSEENSISIFYPQKALDVLLDLQQVTKVYFAIIFLNKLK